MRIKILITGHGGSGTRIVARFFQMLGKLDDSDCNESLDYLPFTRVKNQPNPAHIEGLKSLHIKNEVIKEPHLSMLIDKCMRVWPDSKIVFVIRHGLEMAFTREHWQYMDFAVPLYGFPKKCTPANMLDWWIFYNTMWFEFYTKIYPVHILNWNNLVENPADEILPLMHFCGYTPTKEMYAAVMKPASWQRYKGKEDLFSEEQIAKVRQFGFKI